MIIEYDNTYNMIILLSTVTLKELSNFAVLCMTWTV